MTSQTPDPLIYVVEIDLPPEDGPRALATFSRWYANVHAPHLYEAGFTTCTSYRAVRGGMGIVLKADRVAFQVFRRENPKPESKSSTSAS